MKLSQVFGGDPKLLLTILYSLGDEEGNEEGGEGETQLKLEGLWGALTLIKPFLYSQPRKQQQGQKKAERRRGIMKNVCACVSVEKLCNSSEQFPREDGEREKGQNREGGWKREMAKEYF